MRLPASQLPPGEDFSRAFEDRLGGARELARSRLCVYLPFIEPLKSIEHHPAAVDLGCGRGEWVDLLTEHGFDAQGVDLDDGMLEACRKKGLRVTKADAVAFLKSLANEAQSIVSGLHIAEHLPFSELQNLVGQALRVLKPGGILILETATPESIQVAPLEFYVNPAQRQPLPPALLSFLPEYYGFARIKIIRLQERSELSELSTLSSGQVSNSAKRDYAVIAQKAAEARVARLFDSDFHKDFRGPHELVEGFDRQQATQIERAAVLETGLVRASPQPSELAWLTEVLAANSAWMQSLHSQLIAKTEAITTREVELERTNLRLSVQDKTSREHGRGARRPQRGDCDPQGGDRLSQRRACPQERL